MSLDFIRNHAEESAFNFSLHEINSTLKQHGLSCSSFHLPVPTGDVFQAPLYNKLEEQEDAKRRIHILTHRSFMPSMKLLELFTTGTTKTDISTSMVLEDVEKLTCILHY
ncbi:hypothetical protein AVEN_170517-1 [Araneus ventricosus]|uniref:Uncharacterized protein n=1 Tax=Araneus ventricosus TaxID=182803 RepID=A0A4Y2BYX3_ARAVE|nr:hypothetical protein AVEN_170517-1 [Araneus ventricosus]